MLEDQQKNSENLAVRRSFAEAQIIEVDEEQLASPASKLDAMFTFLKINFLSMWGTDNLTPQQEEAKIYKIKILAVLAFFDSTFRKSHSKTNIEEGIQRVSF